MQRTRRIFTHGWIGASALNLFTSGYYPATSGFDDSAVVHGLVFGPSAGGAIEGMQASGVIVGMQASGALNGPSANSTIEGPSDVWH